MIIIITSAPYNIYLLPKYLKCYVIGVCIMICDLESLTFTEVHKIICFSVYQLYVLLFIAFVCVITINVLITLERSTLILIKKILSL